ncbi:MAG TPA: hypothetical protein VFL94_14745 [Actinomycetales bacterium]|nr:hypothetical protein [Actinomycetales bacterium]
MTDPQLSPSTEPVAEPRPGPDLSEPGPSAPGPTVPEPPSPPSQPQPAPPEVPSPPDVPTPPADPGNPHPGNPDDSGHPSDRGVTSDVDGSGDVDGSSDVDAASARGKAVPALPRTGDAQVDGALERLADVTTRPLEEQVEVYVGAHRRLQDRLADLDG